MEELLISACKDYISDSFTSALEKLGKIIETNSDNLSQKALLYRANTYQKLGEFKKSLEDLENLLNSANKNSNVESFEMFYKLGQINFDLENFEKANEHFKQALSVSCNEEQREKLIIAINKNDIELKERDLTATVLPYEPTQAQEKYQSVTNKSNYKFFHNWFQTNTHIIVSIDCSVPLNSEEYSISIEKRLVKVLKGKAESLYELHLCNSINANDSTYSINNRKTEIKLKKEIENFQWVTLEQQSAGNVNTISESGNLHGFKPSYPTSSKVQKDWDNINKEITKELDTEDVKGNDAMMKLFKQIYERGNEETRRAMIKSFQTSGGTVLSTNWGEVKEKEYEGKDRPTAPDGQEWADKVYKD